MKRRSQDVLKTMPSKAEGMRWWPCGMITALAGSAIIAIRLRPTFSYQERNIASAKIVLGALGLIIVWLLLGSRLRVKTRILAVISIATTLAGAASLIRIRGVSGDLLPVLEWRLSRSDPSHWRAPVTPLPPSTVSDSNRSAVASESDYPQFLGPYRNGATDGPRLASDWSARPPRLLWRQEIGPAWSGFAVHGSLAITAEQRGDEETINCYDLWSGTTLWTHSDAAHYHTTIAGDGPRTTPAIADGHVFTSGATGILNCLDLTSGRVLWSKNVVQENGGAIDDWGYSCSPLVANGMLIVTTGAGGERSLVAYKSDTGTKLWNGGRDRASYSSPLLANIGGTPQVLVFNSHSLTGHGPTIGSVLWEHPWPSGHPHITVPLVLTNNRVVVSSGYGIGSELLQVEHRPDGTWGARRVWKSIRLKSKFADLIQVEGYLYGLDDGILVCLDLANGELKWKEGRYGHGQLVRRHNLLLIMAENGEVALIAPNPSQRDERTRFQALRTKTWNPPALAGRFLLVRNDQEAACYELPLAVPP